MKSMFILALLLIQNLNHFEKLFVPKQRKGNVNTMAKFWGGEKYPSIDPLLSFWLNDNDIIIIGLGLGCKNESIDQGRSYMDSNINISECFFLRYSQYSGNGGVIYVSVSSFSMNVNYTRFYNCLSNNGGAIYFHSQDLCICMTCAYRCSASYYHFAYLRASLLNQIEYLSVSKCSHTTSGYYSVFIMSGNQRINNINSSMNNAIQISGIDIESPSSLTSSLCTFSHNKVSDSRCIYIYYSSGIISMSYANIVYNDSPSYGVVYIAGTGIRKMVYCIFQNNQDYLFCIWGGSLEVSHSFIDHSSSSFSTSAAVSTATNNSFTYRITYQIQYFNSIYCNADIPFSTPMSTIIQTLQDSPPPTIAITNTPNPTPYRSFVELSPHQTLFPEHTPHQSLFPIHTPYRTHFPENTIQRSFPVDFVEKTPSISTDQSNNNIDENKSNSIFIFSTVGLIIVILVMISYNFGIQKNQNNISSSSTSLEIERIPKKEEITKNENCNNNENKGDQEMDHHNDSFSSPYVF